jgi:hypothetical protein
MLKRTSAAIEGMVAMVSPPTTADGYTSFIPKDTASLPSNPASGRNIATMPSIATHAPRLSPEIDSGRSKKPKTGGRKKGTPNHVTRDIRASLRDLAEGNAHRVQEWLDRVAEDDPAEATRLWLYLLRYVTPTLAAAAIADITPKSMSHRVAVMSDAELLAILHGAPISTPRALTAALPESAPHRDELLE